MTRSEALATISAAVAHADGATLAAITAAVTELSTLDREGVLTVADVIRDMKAEQASLRQLTARERDLIAQSKADFDAGRTYSTEDAFARIDAGLAARRAARAQA
jgi:cell division protein FtsB